MLIGDLIYSDAFDVNCNYAIYDCRSGKAWNESDLLFSTYREGYTKPLDFILDLHVGYITIDLTDKCLVIEAKWGKKKLFAYDIEWDGDSGEIIELPDEIEIPEDIAERYREGKILFERNGYENGDNSDYTEEISDFISDLTGFCHYGFHIREEV